MYKLINRITGETHFCEKVTIEGFDYYLGDKIQLGVNNVWVATKSRIFKFELHMAVVKSNMPRKVIATNNPDIDIPQVVDETLDYKFDREFFNPLIAPIVNEIEQKDYRLFLSIGRKLYDVLFENYKSQETHPFSEEDADAYADAVMGGCLLRAKEWKSQQPKKVYYE